MSEQMREKLAIAVAAMDSGKISAAELEMLKRNLLKDDKKEQYKNPCTSLNPSVSKAYKSRR